LALVVRLPGCRPGCVWAATRANEPEADLDPLAGSGVNVKQTPAAIGDSIADMLAARGIHYHPLFTFKELRPETGEVVASDGRSQTVDLLIGVPPHQAPDVVRSSPFLGVSGFTHVDAKTLQTDHDHVFAIGDVATVRLPNDKALPKAGVFAHSEAKVVAERIADKLDETSRAAFDGKGYCWVELGDGRAGFAGGELLRRARAATQAEAPRAPAALGQGRLREVVAPPLALARPMQARSAINRTSMKEHRFMVMISRIHQLRYLRTSNAAKV
jgi:Pyridine nucleotide-disulphide oxidoreductase